MQLHPIRRRIDGLTTQVEEAVADVRTGAIIMLVSAITAIVTITVAAVLVLATR